MSLDFLNKFDYFLFGKLDENHIPDTVTAVKTVFLGGVVVSLLMLIIGFSGVQESTRDWIIGGSLLLLWGAMFYFISDTLKNFRVWWHTVLYVVYLLIISGIVFQLAVWSFLIACMLVLFYGILKFFFSSPVKAGNKVKIYYDDGTVEEGKVESGLTGEKTVRTRDGQDIQL